MNLSEYSKEKELEKDLQNLLEGKVTLSKSEILDFLKRDEEVKNIEFVEEENSDEIVFKDLVEEQPEEQPDSKFTQSPQIPNPLMDRLLDEYEDQVGKLTLTEYKGNVYLGGGGENNTISNIGGGVEIYSDKYGPDLRLRTFSATGLATVNQVGNLIIIGANTSGASSDSWTSVSGDYYTSNEVDNLISAVSADNDSWTIVSADYYTKEETVNGTPTFREVIFDNNLSSNPEYKEGTLFYDSTDKTLTLYPHVSGVSLQIGQETYVKARNNTGSVIENGSVVEIYGALGNRPLIKKSISKNIIENHCVLGVVTHDIEHNTDGFVTTEGVVGSLNTDAYEEGTTLYLSTTISGAFTSAIPEAPYYNIKIGYVIRKNPGDGKILVKIETKGRLTELSDVDSIVPDDYSMLTYYESSGFWNPSTSGQWDDLTFPATQTKQGSNLKPTYDETNLGLLFPQNDETAKVYINAQLPHKRKYNTPIKPHIHFVQTTSALPIFKMEYKWYNNGEAVPSSFITTTTSASSGVFPYTSGSMLQIIEFPEIDGTNKTLSSVVDMIIYRQTGDGVIGNVLEKDIDIHYKSDSYGGSREEFIK